MTKINDMRKLKTTAKAIGTLLFSALLLPSCSDKMEDYYETPGWIQGSIYEKLQDEGQYSQFLRGVERAGFTPMLNGKAILTVMAPNDEAMRTYLQANYNVSTIDEVPEAEVKKLIGFHLLYYAYDKDKLMNFRPSEGDGASDEQKTTKAGLYYKFRTRSQDPVEFEADSAYVYHPDRFIPIFSNLMFRTKGIEASGNYSYFFPETGWTGNNSFQVANANVLNADDKNNTAKNGYIYKVDRVLRPMETIYKELKNAGKYTRFVSFYDQYKNYQKSTDLTRDFASTDEQKAKGLYTITFGDLPAIADEWPTSDYKAMAILSHRTYSIFAPTDEAIVNFFNDYWKVGGYDNIDEVPATQMQNLLLHSIFQEKDASKDQSMIFPEEIESGKIQDNGGNTIKFNTGEVPQADRIICSNGVLYGCSVLTPPMMFNSVTGPAYQYKKFSTFGAMLSPKSLVTNGSNLDDFYSKEAVSYIMLYPDNAQFENSEMNITVSSTTPANIMKKEAADLEAVSMGSGIVQAYVNSHAVLATDGNTVLPTGNSKPVAIATMQGTMQSSPMKVYWYVKNGKITNSIQFLKALKYQQNTATEADIWANFHALDYRGDVNGWTNGHAYSYDNLLFRGDYKSTNPTDKFFTLISNYSDDTTADFYGWQKLLSAGGFIAASKLSFMAENCLMFVPTTQAIANAIVSKKIPGTKVADGTLASDADFFSKIEVEDKKALQEYLYRYFVPLSTAVITNYPYLGWGEITETLDEGGLITMQMLDNSEPPVVTKSYVLNIFDDGAKLSVQTKDLQTGETSNKVNVVSTYEFLPFVFDDGVVHFIEDVL